MGSATKLKFLLREFVDNDSGNYSFLVADMGCPGHPAALIDPVESRVETYEQMLKEIGLKLVYIMNTHVPCDYTSGASLLKKRFPEAKTVISTASGDDADILVEGGDTLHIGNLALEVKSTPGHTKGCVTYVTRPHSDVKGTFAFTGHSLLVRGCGRTDIKGGDAEELFKSVHSQLFSLHPNTHIMPGADYNRAGFTISSVREEIAYNPHFIQK